MVVTLMNDDVPGGYGTFRIQSYRVNRDWSVDFTAKSVTDSMYDLTTGEVPAAVSDAVLPPSGPRDSGLPPTPAFSVAVSPSDQTSIEIRDLSFGQATNTRTITSVTFNVILHEPASPRIVTVNFPAGFFATEAAEDWSLLLPLPGQTVLQVDAYASNAYGDSEVETVAEAELVLAGEPIVSHGFAATFDGAGKELVAGMVAYLEVPVGGSIAAWNILVDAGTCTIQVWKMAQGTAIPVVGNSISTSGVSISSGTAIHSETLSDFTTLEVADGDLIAVYLHAVSGATKVFFSVEIN
jgi:hypothetical protein